MRHFPALIISVALMACAQTTQVDTSAAGPRGSTRPDARLSDADRARQVLNRLTFGARPGDLAAIERTGVKAWVEQQLHPESIPDPVADSVLGLLDITHKNAFELSADYPQANDFGAVATQSKLFGDLNKRRFAAMR